MGREDQDHIAKHAERMREQLLAVVEFMAPDEVTKHDYELCCEHLVKVSNKSTVLARAIRASLGRQSLLSEARRADWDKEFAHLLEVYEIENEREDQQVKENATSGMTMEKRIEAAFSEAIRFRAQMEENAETMRSIEEETKLQDGNYEEYVGAKNNEIRTLMLSGWLRENTQWSEAREAYRKARRDLKGQMLEIESLKLLVAAGGAR